MAAVVSLIITGVIISRPSYSFADSISVKCATSSSSDDCLTSTNSNNSISDIGDIDTTDPIAYRQELIKKLQDKSAANLKDCKDSKAALASQQFESQVQAYYVNLCSMDSGIWTRQFR